MMPSFSLCCNRMKTRGSILWLTGFVACAIHGQNVTPPPWYFTRVVPSNLSETIEGADTTAIPFANFGFTSFEECNSCRYQQIFSAEDFKGLPQENGYIWSFMVRADTCNADATSFHTLMIKLSTTQKTPDNLSMKFSENIGQDQTDVYGGPNFGGFLGGGSCQIPARFQDNWYILTTLAPSSSA